MYIIEVSYNGKERRINVDDLVDHMEKYGDKRVELSKIPATSKNPLLKESRRKLNIEARDMLLGGLEVLVTALVVRGLAAFDTTPYVWKCVECKRGFNDLNDLILHATDPKNPTHEACRQDMVKQMAERWAREVQSS